MSDKSIIQLCVTAAKEVLTREDVTANDIATIAGLRLDGIVVGNAPTEQDVRGSVEVSEAPKGINLTQFVCRHVRCIYAGSPYFTKGETYYVHPAGIEDREGDIYFLKYLSQFELVEEHNNEEGA